MKQAMLPCCMAIEIYWIRKKVGSFSYSITNIMIISVHFCTAKEEWFWNFQRNVYAWNQKPWACFEQEIIYALLEWNQKGDSSRWECDEYCIMDCWFFKQGIQNWIIFGQKPLSLKKIIVPCELTWCRIIKKLSIVKKKASQRFNPIPTSYGLFQPI